ncbi:uncharacterized protein BDR25DRAFT_384221 [Lindgomyces ingoldianus]|uniref:Uncharacterized protein n=1 Tax=Lindgomyces ingoldianus TaxID=673940 RepID=A0ACB6R6Q1_9PLEO|nr:uncharacterized protein BDR25DRAFT_384221 [Lindgomyces ingoldianus]KAF2474836.1 hypothetical protein BDR25DRAFT_384221 [Lindgomyces ingoldianus]
MRIIIHQADKNAQGVLSQQYAYVAQLLLFPALSLSKLSICLAYLRIFFSDTRGRILIRIIIVVLALTIVPFFFEVMFQCKPIHVYWTEIRPASKCLNDFAGLIINGTLNVLCDIALILIVIPRIWDLKLNPRQKSALIGIVMLGWLAVIAGIVRMVRVGTVLRMPNFDPPWDTYDVSIWTSTEIYASLICAAAPGVKPLVSVLLPRLLGTTFRSYARTKKGTTKKGTMELGSKIKRNSSLGTRHEAVSITRLTEANGISRSEVVGGDEESLNWKNDGGSVRDSVTIGNGEGKIYKKSEVVISVS